MFPLGLDSGVPSPALAVEVQPLHKCHHISKR